MTKTEKNTLTGEHRVVSRAAARWYPRRLRRFPFACQEHSMRPDSECCTARRVSQKGETAAGAARRLKAWVWVDSLAWRSAGGRLAAGHAVASWWR